MMTDGTWTVQVISLNGQQLLRVTNRKIAKVMQAGDGRSGAVRMATGWWWGDFRRVEDLPRELDLASLS